jgi:hypothetical protein
MLFQTFDEIDSFPIHYLKKIHLVVLYLVDSIGGFKITFIINKISLGLTKRETLGFSLYSGAFDKIFTT